MTYNMTFVDSATSLIDFVSGVNDLTGGLFIVLTMFLLYIILLSVTRGQGDNAHIMLAVSFIMLIISGLLWASGLIGWIPLIAPASLFMSMVIYNFFWNREG